MKQYLVDVPVLLIFFTRPDHFKQVFEQVKKARPSKLFLYQDGPRKERVDDVENIKKCREIAEEIDWDCKVKHFYQENNVGCDPSMFIAIKWAFKHVDRCVILEDDVVPSQSFFPFCKELLERYCNDERITMISGMNHLDISEGNPYSYLFTKNQSIWGWATWKRNVDLWDKDYVFLDDENTLKLLKQNVESNYQYSIETCKRHKISGREHFESISWSSQNLNSMINIVPTKNMISNIGIGENGTHSSSSLYLMPKALQKLFFKERYEIEFPLKHPKYVMEDKEYTQKLNKMMGIGHPFLARIRSCEGLIRILLYAEKNEKIALRNRFLKKINLFKKG